ncbi:MAG TPA: hypothetical protein VFH25_06305 [Nitrososphaeraceae archaeon]|jgi:hypothetical protein|nr:hypothetical protein [Nitrososphaeraceae archaeon]
MSSNQEPTNESDVNRSKLQKNMNGNENSDATPAEDVLTKEEEKEEEKAEYYEEGNGGATD